MPGNTNVHNLKKVHSQKERMPTQGKEAILPDLLSSMSRRDKNHRETVLFVGPTMPNKHRLLYIPAQHCR
jgi:hypothetical protein